VAPSIATAPLSLLGLLALSRKYVALSEVDSVGAMTVIRASASSLSEGHPLAYSAENDCIVRFFASACIVVCCWSAGTNAASAGSLDSLRLLGVLLLNLRPHVNWRKQQRNWL
jgi:hypothetical protein